MSQTDKNRSIYAVPEYVVSKYIPEHILKHIPVMKWSDAYNYSTVPVTVSDLAKLQDLENFDTAVPIEWAHHFKDKTGFDPNGHFVTDYTNTNFGIIVPITTEGEIAYNIYMHITGEGV